MMTWMLANYPRKNAALIGHVGSDIRNRDGRTSGFGRSVVVGHASSRRAREPERAQQALFLLGREVGG
jgi:hypothetical protein